MVGEAAAANERHHSSEAMRLFVPRAPREGDDVNTGGKNTDMVSSNRKAYTA